ncbi:MAG: pyridoxal phosphate-dependent aminotransferase [Kiloniellales bacterium]
MNVPDMQPALRRAIAELESSKIVELWELGFGRDDLIGLWVGEGDLATPGFICQAAAVALGDGHTFYTHKRGLPELRQAIVDYQTGLYRRPPVELERVSVTQSGMNGIMIAMQMLVDAGDNVACVSPVWPNVYGAIRIMDAEVRHLILDSGPDGGFSLDLERLFAAVDRRTRAVFIASPGNPTGWAMPAEQQRAVLDFCRARGIWIVADEVYARFVYDRPVEDRPAAPSFLEIIEPEDRVLVVNSFSKAWAMTGWRLGWVTHPGTMAAVFDKVIEYNTSGAQAFLQYGALAALRDGEAFVRTMVSRCRRGRDVVARALKQMPRVRLAEPEAGFYAFFAVDGMTDSLATAKELLHATGVGLAPGVAFGPGGEGHLRLCFASATGRLEEAMARLRPLLS